MLAPKSYVITAFQLGDALPIKSCRATLVGRIISAGSQELFYGPSENEMGFILVLNYGVVVYAGRGEADMSTMNHLLLRLAQNPLEQPLREAFRVHSGAHDLEFGFNEFSLPEITDDVLRIVMLHVGQSVALDYYESLADTLMQAPNTFIESLTKHGKLTAPRRAVMKYIGEAMSMRSRIIDNLYVLDAPDMTWDDETLDRIDRGMKKTFDTVTRFRALEDQLEVVQTNLELFVELLQHRQSNLLEWIIIGLILIEVSKLLVESLF